MLQKEFTDYKATGDIVQLKSQVSTLETVVRQKDLELQVWSTKHTGQRCYTRCGVNEARCSGTGSH